VTRLGTLDYMAPEVRLLVMRNFFSVKLYSSSKCYAAGVHVNVCALPCRCWCVPSSTCRVTTRSAFNKSRDPCLHHNNTVPIHIQIFAAGAGVPQQAPY
jgi:hypothetical protein